MRGIKYKKYREGESERDHCKHTEARRTIGDVAIHQRSHTHLNRIGSKWGEYPLPSSCRCKNFCDPLDPSSPRRNLGKGLEEQLLVSRLVMYSFFFWHYFIKAGGKQFLISELCFFLFLFFNTDSIGSVLNHIDGIF